MSNNNDENKKPNKFISIVLIVFALTLLGIVGIESKRQQTTQENPNTNGQIADNEIVYYYGITCPHCDDVKDFIDSEDIENKIPLVSKEVYENILNSQELIARAESCGLNTNNIGVPFLYSDRKCYSGSPDVISEIQRQVGEYSKEVSEWKKSLLF